jgi:hypothetical protein
MVITKKYRIIFFEGLWNVFKEVSIFGCSLYGEMLNNRGFINKEDAEELLKVIEDGGK